MRLTAAWLPALLVAALIFALSSVSGLAVSSGVSDLILRKGAHLTIYGVLALACVRGLQARPVREPALTAGALALTALYACTDEYHQTFVAGRHGSPVDVGIDLVGAALGLTLWRRSGRVASVVVAG